MLTNVVHATVVEYGASEVETFELEAADTSLWQYTFDFSLTSRLQPIGRAVDTTSAAKCDNKVGSVKLGAQTQQLFFQVPGKNRLLR